MPEMTQWSELEATWALGLKSSGVTAVLPFVEWTRSDKSASRSLGSLMCRRGESKMQLARVADIIDSLCKEQ